MFSHFFLVLDRKEYNSCQVFTATQGSNREIFLHLLFLREWFQQTRNKRKSSTTTFFFFFSGVSESLIAFYCSLCLLQFVPHFLCVVIFITCTRNYRKFLPKFQIAIKTQQEFIILLHCIQNQKDLAELNSLKAESTFSKMLHTVCTGKSQ